MSSILLVLADDLTGAIDTGVQFASKGISTIVIHDIKLAHSLPTDPQVIIINTQTRNSSKDDAYVLISKVLSMIKKANITYIYKKTDSGLRGNVGAELQAVMDSYPNGVLAFAPAYPDTGRTVINGRLFIDGLPVSQSVFGRDPFKPVRFDCVSDIIHAQTQLKIVDSKDPQAFSQGIITLFDSISFLDLQEAAKEASLHSVALFAGCAGFAESLISCLPLISRPTVHISLSSPSLFISGSISEITFKQINYALAHGLHEIMIEPVSLLTDNFVTTSQGSCCISRTVELIREQGAALISAAKSSLEAELVYTFGSASGLSLENIKTIISRNLGQLLYGIYSVMPYVIPVIFGGDTLSQVLHAFKTIAIHPICEVERGTVLSQVTCKEGSLFLVSKSGSFGDTQSIARIRAFVSGLGKCQT